MGAHGKFDANNPVVTWNTGKMYTPEGQKMAAVLVDGHIYWMDFSRKLEGSVQARRYEYHSSEIRKIVDFVYLHNVGDDYIKDTEVKERLETYKDLVDSAARQDAFNAKEPRNE